MKKPSVNCNYHLIKFRNVSEAAAFVAALLSFLNYPQGNFFLPQPDAIEIWVRHQAIDQGAEIYLNDEMLVASTAAFGSTNVSDTVLGQDMPTTCALLIEEEQMPSWGIEDVQKSILSKLAKEGNDDDQ